MRLVQEAKGTPEAHRNVSVLTGSQVTKLFLHHHVNLFQTFVFLHLHVRLNRQKNRSCTGSAAGFLCFASAQVTVSVGVTGERSSTCWSEQVSSRVDFESEGNYFLGFCVNVARKQNPRDSNVKQITTLRQHLFKTDPILFFSSVIHYVESQFLMNTSQHDPGPCAPDPGFAPLSRSFRSSGTSASYWSTSQPTVFVALYS